MNTHTHLGLGPFYGHLAVIPFPSLFLTDSYIISRDQLGQLGADYIVQRKAAGDRVRATPGCPYGTQETWPLVPSPHYSRAGCLTPTGNMFRNCTQHGWSETFPRPDVACGVNVNDSSNEKRVSLLPLPCLSGACRVRSPWERTKWSQPRPRSGDLGATSPTLCPLLITWASVACIPALAHQPRDDGHEELPHATMMLGGFSHETERKMTWWLNSQSQAGESEP